MLNRILASLALLTVASSILSGKWNTELPDDVIVAAFAGDAKQVLFWSTGDYIGAKDIDTGSDIWKVELDDWESDGAKSLSEKIYVTIDNETLKAFDVVSGAIKWKVSLNDIDGDDFRFGYFADDDLYIIAFEDDHFGIDAENGNVLWSMDIKHREFEQGERVYQTYSFDYPDYFSVLVDDRDMIYTIGSETGKVVGSQIDFVPQEQFLARNGRYHEAIGKSGLSAYIGEDKTIIIEDKSGRVEAYLKDEAPESYSPVSNLGTWGDLILNEEATLLIDSSGNISRLPYSYKDLRIVKPIEHEGRELLFVSVSGEISIYDPTVGRAIWKSNGEELEDGYVHDVIGIQNGVLFAAYSDHSMFGGTWIRVFAYDMASGALKWKSGELLATNNNIPDITRWLADAYKPDSPLSWYNPGMLYGSGITQNGDIWLASSWPNQPKAPEDIDVDEGNGLVIINSKDGALVHHDFLLLNDEYNYSNSSHAQVPIEEDGIIYMVGTTHAAAFEAETGKRLWYQDIRSEEHDEFLVEEVLLEGDVLICRSGGVKRKIFIAAPYIAGLFDPSVKIGEERESEPHVIFALDAKSGKKLWSHSSESPYQDLDMGYTLKGALSDDKKSILIPSKNTFKWQSVNSSEPARELSISDYEIEDVEDSYAVQTFFIYSVRERTEYYRSYRYVWEVKREYVNIDEEEASLMTRAMKRAEAISFYEQLGNHWGATATRVLGKWNLDKDVLLVGSTKIGRINTSTGERVWELNWEFDESDFDFAPITIGGVFFYVMDGEAKGIDLETGKESFSIEVEDDSRYIINNEMKKLLIYWDEEIYILDI